MTKVIYSPILGHDFPPLEALLAFTHPQSLSRVKEEETVPFRSCGRLVSTDITSLIPL